MQALNLICYVAFAAIFVALPFFIFNWIGFLNARKKGVEARVPKRSIAALVACFLLLIASIEGLKGFARREAVEALRELGHSGDGRVFVNDHEQKEGGRLIEVLLGTTPYWAHHSHTTVKIAVRLEGKGSKLELVLGRDSQLPREYWVFYPNYGMLSRNDIGRVTTDLFDAIK